MSTEDQKAHQNSSRRDPESETGEQAQNAESGEQTPEEAQASSAEQEETAQQADNGEGGAENEAEKLREDLLRAHAEMQNMRRRAERDVEHAHKFALEKFVSELLPVVDNLERALKALEDEGALDSAVGEGIQLTRKSFLDALQRFNVEPIDPVGEPFDPDKHQAMTTVPSPDHAPNTVIEVFQKGYLLNGRLVRPAMVVVSKEQ